MPATRTRLFSDLHYRDPRSALHDFADLAPLFDNTDAVVLNGDTLDTEVPGLPDHRDDLHAFLATKRPAVVTTILSGNHDPFLSDLAEHSLADDRVWVTHGDVFFEHIAPWSRYRPELARRIAVHSAGFTPDELARVETRLRIHRLAARGLACSPALLRRTPLARLRRLLSTVLPPTRFLKILQSWRDTPRLVAALARAQRPRAQAVILGHTHRPGVWRLPAAGGAPALTVINTGSFSRVIGGLCVDHQGEHLLVRRLVRGARGFVPGAQVAEITLAP